MDGGNVVSWSEPWVGEREGKGRGNVAAPCPSCRLLVAHPELGLQAECDLAVVRDLRRHAMGLHLPMREEGIAALLVDEPEFSAVCDEDALAAEPVALQFVALVHELAAGLGLDAIITVERLLAARRWDRLWGGHLVRGTPFVRGGLRQAFWRRASLRRAAELRRHQGEGEPGQWRFACRSQPAIVGHPDRAKA